MSDDFLFVYLKLHFLEQHVLAVNCSKRIFKNNTGSQQNSQARQENCQRVPMFANLDSRSEETIAISFRISSTSFKRSLEWPFPVWTLLYRAPHTLVNFFDSPFKSYQGLWMHRLTRNCSTAQIVHLCRRGIQISHEAGTFYPDKFLHSSLAQTQNSWWIAPGKICRAVHQLQALPIFKCIRQISQTVILILRQPFASIKQKNGQLQTSCW